MQTRTFIVMIILTTTKTTQMTKVRAHIKHGRES